MPKPADIEDREVFMPIVSRSCRKNAMDTTRGTVRGTGALSFPILLVARLPFRTHAPYTICPAEKPG